MIVGYQESMQDKIEALNSNNIFTFLYFLYDVQSVQFRIVVSERIPFNLIKLD